MRRFFSRLLLLVLIGVLVYAIIRLSNGPREPDAVVSFGTSLDVGLWRHEAFEVERPVRLAIHAVGSFETDSSLAATAWIVRRSDGKVIWDMVPEAVERGRGTLATADDTLAFEAGVYDAYFASYGDPDLYLNRANPSLFQRVFGGDGRVWRSDEGRWRFRVRYASDADQGAARRLYGDEGDPAEALATLPGLIWTSGPVRNRETTEYLFEVTEAVPVRIRAVGEVVEGEVIDGAEIQTLAGHETVWAMTADAEWAGGARRNRRADTVLTLAPGLYRARYTTDRSHAYRSWHANPPYVPEAWGLTLTAEPADGTARVAALDPWQRLPRIASFTCVGVDAYREDTFTLPDTTDVLLVAMGEILSGSEYDYATLYREDRGSRVEVWTMEQDNTVHGGGADKNRRAEVALQLVPATYTLTYQTDSSHDCSDFNSDPPPDPEHWGATLFALDMAFDPARVEHTVNIRDGADADRRGEETLLVGLQRIGNNANVSGTFTLDSDAIVRIYAVGELIRDERYDYAWITPATGPGRIVWEMTGDNTDWAGGSKKNRVFDGTASLGAGSYTVHFRSNESHAYEVWDQPEPNDDEAWGVAVWRQDG